MSDQVKAAIEQARKTVKALKSVRAEFVFAENATDPTRFTVAHLEEMIKALSAVEPQAGEEKHVIEFGKGDKVVTTGKWGEECAVFVEPAKIGGEVGQYLKPEEEHPLDKIEGEALILIFPTDAQCSMVADALCNVPPAPDDGQGVDPSILDFEIDRMAKCISENHADDPVSDIWHDLYHAIRQDRQTKRGGKDAP